MDFDVALESGWEADRPLARIRLRVAVELGAVFHLGGGELHTQFHLGEVDALTAQRDQFAKPQLRESSKKYHQPITRLYAFRYCEDLVQRGNRSFHRPYPARSP